MAVTATDVQEAIRLRVGDLDASTGDPLADPQAPGLLALLLPSLWALYADKALVAPRLQELYVLRAALQRVLAVLAARVDVSEGPSGLSVRQSQWAADRRAFLATVEADIAALEAQARIARGPAVGALTTRAPVTPPLPLPGPLLDANDARYAGSPYAPGRLGQFP